MYQKIPMEHLYIILFITLNINKFFNNKAYHKVSAYFFVQYRFVS